MGPEGGARLIFSDPVRGPAGEILSVVAVVDMPGLRAERKVTTHYATHFNALISYFDNLAESWRGWAGSKVYTSLEGDLVVSAVNDGGAHVRLAVTLNGPTWPLRWSVSAEVITDPGAQMAEAAEALRVLLAPRT